MNFNFITGLLIFANVVNAGWDKYERAILSLHKLGLKNDPSFARTRSIQTWAIQFPCNPIKPSSETPTSVHRLRPGDFKLIGALGDSLTAANGANALTILGLLTEYRGLSWSVGGNENTETVTTLPNFLRKYNPNLKGYSIGNGKHTSSGSKFNVAQPGHTSHEMPAQAQELVKRIKSDGSVNFNEDWKLVTLFIGGNDLCDYCTDKPKFASEKFLDNIKQTLDYLHENLPRTLVNLVSTLDVGGIRDLNKAAGFICRILHDYLCECGIASQNADELDALVAEYQAKVQRLIESGRYDTNDNFTVVIQPFLQDMDTPRTPDGEPDFSFFAPDCFHFSKKGHEKTAIELWNNMMEPVGKKRTKWTTSNGDSVVCPSEETPYVFTNKNSGSLQTI